MEIDVSNLRTVNTDERKNETKTDSGAIKDYDSFEDAGEIRRSITDLKVSLSFRLAVLAVLLVFVTFISVGELISLPVPELLTRKKSRGFFLCAAYYRTAFYDGFYGYGKKRTSESYKIQSGYRQPCRVLIALLRRGVPCMRYKSKAYFLTAPSTYTLRLR